MNCCIIYLKELIKQMCSVVSVQFVWNHYAIHLKYNQPMIIMLHNIETEVGVV